MTLILMSCGFAIHRVVIHARWLNLVQEMQQMAIHLENRIKPALKQPGQFDATAQRLLPELCLNSAGCSQSSNLPESLGIKPFRALEGKDYCLRFLDRHKQVVASLQFPKTNLACQEPQFWHP